MTTADEELADADRPLIALGAFITIADGLDHPECVATGPDGRLYAGGEAGQIYSLDPSPAVLAETGGFVLGLCLDARSQIYACDQVRHEVVVVTNHREVESYSDRIEVPNYPVFDMFGNLFVTDSGDWDGRNGSLYRIGPGGRAAGAATEELDIGLNSFPNGLALSPDGEWLYVVLSQEPGVARVALRDGQPVGLPELILVLPDHVPDGIAVLDSGDLVIACYAPDSLYLFDVVTGRLRLLAHDPRRVVLAAPTNVAFHGDDLSDLAVGSLGRWHVASASTEFRGSKLNYPSRE